MFIKKIVKRGMVILLLFFLAQTLLAQVTGDVDFSGTVDIADALKTAQYSVGLRPENFNPSPGDVDGNGVINIVDALMIAQFYVGLISIFPVDLPGGETWDWAGVIGTGQSLAVGEQGKPVESTTQPYNNLKLSTGQLTWPVDPGNTTLAMVPLVEPVEQWASTYPSSWPANMAGETPHTTMASQITVMARDDLGKDYITVQGNVGENGQCMIYLKKNAPHNGVNGRAFESTLIHTRAVTRLAQAQGKTYGIGAVTLTHGECDSGNTNYENDMYQLWLDYNTDLKSITGQEQDILMIVSQQNSQGNNSAATLAQWTVGVNHPENIVCSGPKYQYIYASDQVHLTTKGYKLLGEKYAQIYYERVVRQRDWQPLQPIQLEQSGKELTLTFHVPVPPLAWESSFQLPHQDSNEWKNGKGFEVNLPDNSRATISSVEIVGTNAVRITCANDLPSSGVAVSYAMTAGAGPMTSPHQGTKYWGVLRDSDPFTGAVTGETQPNYCVAFRMTVN